MTSYWATKITPTHHESAPTHAALCAAKTAKPSILFQLNSAHKSSDAICAITPMNGKTRTSPKMTHGKTSVVWRKITNDH